MVIQLKLFKYYNIKRNIVFTDGFIAEGKTELINTLFKNKKVVKEFEFGKVIKYSDRYGKKCCNEWNINIPRIHSGLEMAAANGNPTHLTQQMKYCPYCGVKLDSLPYMTLEDLKHDEELAKKFGITL